MKSTILIVEDNEDIRKFLQEALVEDYDIVIAGEGYAGLAEVMVGRQDIDLIITDLQMPGLNGVELIENLPRDIPVIVISAFLDHPKFRDSLQHLHPAAVIEKPFRISELRQAIQQVFGQ